MTDAYGYWLSGLIDGEGCFRVHQSKSKGPSGWYAPNFSLKLRDDDESLLNSIVETVGFGLVRPDNTRSGGSNPCAVWIVASKASTARLVDLIDVYPLRSRKKKDYEVWRRAVVLFRDMPRGNRWHGPRDWTPMIALKQELEKAREYVGRG